MKKLAILLSLVMVLGMAVSAAAADVTGEVKFETVKNGDADFTFGTSIDLAVNEVVEGATANIDFATGDDNVVAVEYAWVDFADEALPVSLSFGLYDWYDSDVEGVSAKYTVDALTLSGVYTETETDKVFGFYGEYAPTFDALSVKAYAKLLDEVTTLYGKGTYDLGGFKVWADGKKVDDADIVFQAGAETTVASVTLKGKYNVDTEVVTLEASKAYKGVTFAASYETDYKDAVTEAFTGDARIKASAKVAF